MQYIFPKNALVTRTKQHTLVEIPPSDKAQFKKDPVSIQEFVGVLKDVPEFQGKSSVEMQHMIPELWTKRYKKHRFS